MKTDHHVEKALAEVCQLGARLKGTGDGPIIAVQVDALGIFTGPGGQAGRIDEGEYQEVQGVGEAPSPQHVQDSHGTGRLVSVNAGRDIDPRGRFIRLALQHRQGHVTDLSVP